MKCYSRSKSTTGGGLSDAVEVASRRSFPAARTAFAVSLALGVSVGQDALAADQVVYNYDALGRLQSVQYPSGTSVTYNYDPAGNRTQVTNTGGTGSTGGPPLPQRRRLAAIQAILSILLGK